MDNIFKKHGFLICSLSSLLFGAIIFLSFFGYKVLNPLNVNWIFNSQYDVIQNYLGWNYFYKAPWGFPFGAHNSLSYPIITSILNTDSIPLFAIFFKLFKNILPDDFQYWGIYTLFCYMLQSYFGMLITRRFTKNDTFLGNIEAILGGVIFCLIPNITVHTFWHSGLICHFLLLASFIPVVYKFNLKNNVIFYGITGFLAGAINPYLLAISAIVVLFYSIYLCYDKKDIKQFLPFVSYILSAAIVLYFIGAFIKTWKLGYVGLEEFSFNLNAFFNSYDKMKFFTGAKSVVHFQYMCYPYFGLGSLALILITFIHILISFLKDTFDISKYKKETIFIFALIIFSVVLALSPRVTFSDIVLFEIPYPDFIINLWSTFRMTGRFIWITNYIILIFTIGYLIKYFPKKISLIILICSVGLQLWDFTPLITNDKQYLKEENTYYSEYDSELWNRLYEKNNIKYIYLDKPIYDNTRFIVAYIPEILDLVGYCRNKNVKFNSFFLSRQMLGLDEAYFKELENPKDEDIFVFLKNNYYKDAIFSKNLKYYYLYNNLIIARTVKIEGWDDIQISKDEISAE